MLELLLVVLQTDLSNTFQLTVHRKIQTIFKHNSCSVQKYTSVTGCKILSLCVSLVEFCAEDMS